LEEFWQDIMPSEPVRAQPKQLLRAHHLRAADAPQLAAECELRNRFPAVEFVCLDQRLSQAATDEGFTVLS